MFYSIATTILKIFIYPIFLPKIRGRENIPNSGGFILTSNHRSNWDVIMLGCACPRQLNFMAKKELFENRFLSFLISNLNAFPINRGLGDVGAIKTALIRLKKGCGLLLFPEGTRVKEGEAVEAKAGVAMLAVRGKVPVIPMAIVGEYKLFSRLKVTFGEPISFEQYYDIKPDAACLSTLSDGVLQRINQLKALELNA